jgi:hypothetical protein
MIAARVMPHAVRYGLYKPINKLATTVASTNLDAVLHVAGVFGFIVFLVGYNTVSPSDIITQTRRYAQPLLKNSFNTVL